MFQMMDAVRYGTVKYRTITYLAGIATFTYHTVFQKTVGYPKKTFLFTI